MNNILLVANWDSNVGFAWWLMENFWVQINEHFQSQNKKTILIYPTISKIPTTIKKSGITVIQHDFSDQSVKNHRKLKVIINEHNIKYVYLSDKPPLSLYYAKLKLAGIQKIIIHDHTPGNRTTPNPIKAVFKKSINKLSLLSCDHLIATTPFVRERFINSLCWSKEKCSVAQNGIIPITIENKYKHYAHNEFNLPDNTKLIITTGRASYYKGIDFVIKCANELINNRKFQNTVFIYCGDGPDLNEFKQMVHKYKLENNFIIAGKRNDIRKLLQSSLVGIQASKGEVGYSLSILEYMSAGLVTLVPDNPSVNQSIQDSISGFIFKENNISMVCDILTNVLTDKNLRNQVSNSAIKIVNDHYHLKQTNRSLIKILEGIFT